jgi:ribosomal protein S18 acetylase RimI-like enzyme
MDRIRTRRHAFDPELYYGRISSLVAANFIRIQESFRWQGARTTFVRAVRRTVKPLVEIDRFLFFETDLTEPLAQVKPRIALDMHLMTAGDIERFATLFSACGLNLETIHHRLGRGDECILACSGAELAGFHWLSFPSLWLSEIGVMLRLAPGSEVYSYNVVTLPAWRGNRIQPAMGVFARQHAQARGYTQHFTCVRADNPRSLRSLARLERKPTKTIWSIRLLGRQRPILLLGARGAGSPSFDIGGVNDNASFAATDGVIHQPITALPPERI